MSKAVAALALATAAVLVFGGAGQSVITDAADNSVVVLAADRKDRATGTGTIPTPGGDTIQADTHWG